MKAIAESIKGTAFENARDDFFKDLPDEKKDLIISKMIFSLLSR